MLSTEQVSINTMQVEIKSMMVGKKQLTLSLMRQIIEEPLIDEELLQFRGVAWGHVNYFWGDDKHKTFPNHMNIVWQKGNELRRSIVRMELQHEQCMVDRSERELRDVLKQIEYYHSYNGFEEKLNHLNRMASDHRKDIIDCHHRRDVFIPEYHKLVEPLKSLDHFYITV